MTKAEIIDLITEKIRSGGRHTKASDVREVLSEILDSYWNVEDGVTYFIMRSSGVDGHRFKITIDDTGMPQFPGEDLGL